MIANPKETAEQKLLKMIEASAGHSSLPAQSKQKVAKRRSVLAMVTVMNKILVVSIFVSLFFLLAEVAAGTSLLNKKFKFDAGQTSGQRTYGDGDLIQPTQSISYYLAGVNKRNIFVPYEEKKSNAVVVTEKNRKISEVTASLRLVGVSWLDRIDTASVMIEDTEKKITYFLQKGEKLGDIIVKTIYADSAVLGYENEETTIKYDKSQM
ncbi:MAG: hypothetical protein KKF78_05910 [Candidatus Omnitrophica bacterium]|nr:hypothetical protein [Candidatus Omnitrophota bacterium]MBU1996671.1 hypothetical protein [Candidatus Omnitrophota bacterium]